VTETLKHCPFIAGQSVIYRPSARGLDLELVSSGPSKLTPGQEYIVKEIQKERYVVVEGYTHPGGGLYWTEFQAV
jgi:hypothetical protein